MSLIIASGSIRIPGTGNVFGPGLTADLTLDTRGATVIYLFGWATFAVREPDTAWDNQGNTYTLMANPFSTCNGGMQGLRVFNPQTSATHNFRATGNTSFAGTELIVVAFAPTVSGFAYLNNRADSNVFPVKAGADQGPIITPFNDALFVAAAHAGCGWGAGPDVDSGFTIIERLLHMAVAYNTIPLVTTAVDPIWTTLGTLPDQPSPTGGATLEGFGIFTGDQPVSQGNVRIYEA